ncbi:urease accessory protein [Marine Group I thaumarchaeote]|jgi:urease accessory protein|uniref:Urease accessory protein n=1 Tax=Marine Group I thaumarchaeote TaxID=2511932 RepID=A0A7K4M622_9ARCH|nr:MAG: urease accessory protein [Nitrosopumilus sp. YT1]KPU80906.1 urease accessory protein [Nitrosopumilus sp. PRT-SC01]MCH2406027.1 urease accessory protein [Nitrosopumilus sp.]NMI81646.1 urease accessory protein [Candidatus Nitrosopumilus sp. MTA1]NWJ19582.1 urease accessory protein [Marine Group I thaumarchaeote]
MNIDEIEQELGVMQLSDSFFPTGIFATSNGLEFLFTEKKIKGMIDLIEMIRINIIQQIGPSDCVALANAFDSANKQDFDKVVEADSMVFATKLIKEIRSASVRSGVQLIKCVSEFVKDDKILNQYKNNVIKNKAHGVFPVSFAVCCNALKIKKGKSMTMMLYGFTVGIVGAALRLGLIQHFEGQKIIHSIKPIISQTIKEYSNKSLFEMWQFAPQVDIFQMSHEKMDSKMFIT